MTLHPSISFYSAQNLTCTSSSRFIWFCATKFLLGSVVRSVLSRRGGGRTTTGWWSSVQERPPLLNRALRGPQLSNGLEIILLSCRGGLYRKADPDAARPRRSGSRSAYGYRCPRARRALRSSRSSCATTRWHSFAQRSHSCIWMLIS